MSRGTPSSDNEVVPTLNLLLMLKESGVDLFSDSLKDMSAKLSTGVILRDKQNTETQFFWIDKNSKKNCFILLPKSLRINADSQGNQKPCEVVEKENRGTGTEIGFTRVKYEKATLIKVGGNFGTTGLSLNGEYEVVLYLKLMQTGPVYSASTKKLSLPNGNQTQEPWDLVGQIPSGDWHGFEVGRFQMKPNNVGELSFEIQVWFWGRTDIMIKGVAFIPPGVQC